MAIEEPNALVSPVPLMQLSISFWAFKTFVAAHELDLFTRPVQRHEHDESGVGSNFRDALLRRAWCGVY